mgnify:CR=1 FL=1
MVLLGLYILATMDAMFCGYRAAAGRNALINKTAYYRRAMRRGAISGQGAVFILGIAIGVVIASAQHRAMMKETLIQAGARMLLVYIPYAVVVLAAFAARWMRSVDIRSSISALLFGPLTFVRPLVAVAGILWAIIITRCVEVILLGALALALMLSLEKILDWSSRFWQLSDGIKEDFESKTAACCDP